MRGIGHVSIPASVASHAAPSTVHLLFLFRPLQVMLTRPSHMAASFDPDSIKGKAALVRGWRRAEAGRRWLESTS